MKKSQIHKNYNFLLLTFILSLAVLAIYLLQGFPNFQFIVGILLSVSYVIWGLVYHYLEGDLHAKVVIEYLLIALLALILLKGALFR